MFAINENFSKISANGVETALRFAQISLDGTERLVKLQLELSKQTLEDQVKVTRELTTAKDPQEALLKVNALSGQSAEKAVSHSRELYEIVSNTQASLTRLAEEQLGQFNKALIGSLDNLSQNAPAGSDTFLNAFKSSFAASAAALNTLQRAAQQVAEFADTNVKAATSATAEAVKGSRRNASAS
ncbi:phasin family protein [Paludibacterium paludis]|uniref:Phasin family protein n=1 Tax=Paludibacterium paludis TaxID=1225769 RepID=A0A918U809_9NEIS|nr:phasin family protein [Paludibacterium paludis]GGY07214.1 phasin family protein [Paludibacterium paludis]